MADKLPTRLVTAVDIASERVRALPVGTPQAGIAKAVAYQHELQKAKRELAQGDWKLTAA